MTTIAERLKEEGRKEGRKESRMENMHEMIEFALDIKFGMSSKFLVKDIKKINDYGKLEEIKKL